MGKPPKGKNIELDIPQGSGTPGQSKTNTYTGEDGVGVGNIFRKLLYAVKFGDANILLSSRVNENSKILYDRSPRERVQKVAPWLTVDSDALPAMVDGKIVWVLDGYTTSDKYPLAQKKSLEEMTSDAINPRSAYATLPTDHINYMRNAVKATVDAYDGTVKLYEWDTEGPDPEGLEEGVPGRRTAEVGDPGARSSDHMRYPEDLFKVQRDMLAAYHVLDPKTFYEGNDQWVVPQDPVTSTRKQPPYRLSVATTSGQDPVFSLTSVYTPSKRQNLASYMSVGADAADSETYGKFKILRLPDNTQVPGPGQIANQFQRDDKVAQQLLAFRRTDVTAKYGNLLTLPLGKGLLYVQPLYTLREGGEGNYPGLTFVLVSFGREVGIGPTLSAALDDVLSRVAGSDTGTTDGAGSDRAEPDSATGGDTQDLPVAALRLLRQASDKFAEADKALKAGDLEGYADAVDEAQALVQRALNAKIAAELAVGRDPAGSVRGYGEHGLGAAPAQRHRVVLLPVTGLVLVRRLDRLPRGEQSSVDLLGELGQPGGRVHGVADHGVLEPGLVADVAGDRLPGGHAEAGLEVGHLVGQALGHRPSRGQRVAGVVVELDRCTEDRQDGVADELVDQALVPVDLLDDDPEEPVEQLDDLGGLALGGQLGGADQVDEEDRDLTGLTAQLDVPDRGSLGHVPADVLAEQVAQVLAVTQAAHHLVEPRLQLAELGAVVHLHLGVEVTLLDLLQRVADPQDRGDDRAGVEPGDQQPEAQDHPTEHEHRPRPAWSARSRRA